MFFVWNSILMSVSGIAYSCLPGLCMLQAADVIRDDGDSNGKGRGALRKVWFVGLLAISATILIGVATKENGETLMEWGSDVAEVCCFYFPPSFLLLVLAPQMHACAHFVSFSFLVLASSGTCAYIVSFEPCVFTGLCCLYIRTRELRQQKPNCRQRH